MTDHSTEDEVADIVSDDGGRPILEQALDYARFGLKVFPVHATQKRPLPGYAWKELASEKTNHVVDDFTQATEIWGEESTSVAWAIGKDGHVAIDIDVPKDDWPDWASDIVGDAAINLTRRGTHLIFKNPDEFEPGNTDTLFPTKGWGEVRGAGGYVVIAGPDRPGLDLDSLASARKFPHPEWLRPFGGGADAVSWTEVKEFAVANADDGVPGKINGIKAAIDQWDPKNQGDPSKGRHPYCIWLMTTAAEEAAQGYYPFKDAFEMIKDWWEQVTPPERHGRELKGIAAWAVGRTLQNVETPTPEEAEVSDGPDTLLDEGSELQGISPLDWGRFWTDDRTEDDWFIEGFWPRGRAMVLHAKAKEGKSEFVLFCILCLVRGIDPWTGEKCEPKTVCYFDYEMTEDDLLDRLMDMGLDEDDDLSRLRYYLLPAMSPLDTPRGAAELMAIVERDQPDAVVIDTFGRAVEGAEDEADTVRDFYRLTGQKLKAANVGYLRTDHTGKDASKGQRGSSAKNDDVDIIWSMKRTSTGTELASRSRVSWVPEKLTLFRDTEPIVRYRRLEGDLIDESINVVGKAVELDHLGIPIDYGRDKVRRIMKRAGIAPGKNNHLSAAIKHRKKPGYSPAPVRGQIYLGDE